MTIIAYLVLGYSILLISAEIESLTLLIKYYKELKKTFIFNKLLYQILTQASEGAKNLNDALSINEALKKKFFLYYFSKIMFLKKLVNLKLYYESNYEITNLVNIFHSKGSKLRQKSEFT